MKEKEKMIMDLLYEWQKDSHRNAGVLEQRYKYAPKGSALRRRAKAEWDYMTAQRETIDNVIGEIYELMEV